MGARAGRYFGLPFKGYRGMTQGDPLYPTLFNVVVGSVICHWVMVVAPLEDFMEVLALSINYLAAYFNSDNVLVLSNQPERLQRLFDVLAFLFYWVGPRTNTIKTVSMACHPCHAPGWMSSEAYEHWTTETGPTFREHQRRRVD